MATSLLSPFGNPFPVIDRQRGMEGDFKNKCFLMTRDNVLAEMGITAHRISDKDVFEKIDGVMRDMELLMIYKISPPPLCPLLSLIDRRNRR